MYLFRQECIKSLTLVASKHTDVIKTDVLPELLNQLLKGGIHTSLVYHTL